MRIHESPYGGAPNNFHIYKRGATLAVTLTYPNIANAEQCQYIEVDQESVRASDGVRLHYDYARDGWVIEQASTFEWDADDAAMNPDWQEVAFVKSWAREKREPLPADAAVDPQATK